MTGAIVLKQTKTLCQKWNILIVPIVFFQDEFLLNAPSALGMFATSSGISQRPPLQWSDNLVSVVYTHPYILALNDEFVTIHR